LKAIIPAAGVGERLRPLTLTKPKVLLPVAGKPILGHIFDRLALTGIKEVTVIIGYYGEQVREYSLRNYNFNFTFIEQTERKGLGHAVGLGLKPEDGPVLIVLGDVILDLDFRALSLSQQNLIGVMPVEDPRRFGIVELKSGIVTRLIEKPQSSASNLAIAGVYLIQKGGMLKKAVEHIMAHNIKTKNEYQLTDALQVMVEWGEKFGVVDIENCLDCGTRQTLIETNAYLLNKRPVQTPSQPGAVIIPPVFIDTGVVIRRSIVGPNVHLGKGASVTNSVVSNSIISEGAVLKDVVLDQSLIGQKSQVSGAAQQIDTADHTVQKLS
jgi:glucose-1-phosphate thymidylyltransferase